LKFWHPDDFADGGNKVTTAAVTRELSKKSLPPGSADLVTEQVDMLAGISTENTPAANKHTAELTVGEFKLQVSLTRTVA